MSSVWQAESRLQDLRKQVDVLEEREREVRGLQEVKDHIEAEEPILGTWNAHSLTRGLGAGF